MMMKSLILLAVAASCYGASLMSTRLDTLSCGSYTMSPGDRLVLQSPNYPSDYNSNDRCQWNIECPDRTVNKIRMYCPRFALNSANGCTGGDRLAVSPGPKYLCGTDGLGTYETTTGFLRATFFTDSAGTAQGFRCYVFCEPREVPTTPATTTTEATTTTTTLLTTTTTPTTTTTTTTPTTTTTTPTTTTTTPTTTTTTPTTTTTTPTTTTTTPTTTTTTPTTTTTTPTTTTTTPTTTTTTPTTTTTTPTTTTTTPTTTTTTPTTTTTTPTTTTTTPTTTTTTPTTTTTTPTTTTTTPTTTTTTPTTTTTTPTTTTTTPTTTTTTPTTTTTTPTTTTTTPTTTTTTPTTTTTTPTTTTTTPTTTTTTPTTTTTTPTTTTTTPTTTTAAVTTKPNFLSCGQYTMTEGERLAIQSTNYPQNYGTDERCQWEFTCPDTATHQIRMKCPVFDVQGSGADCSGDKIRVSATQAYECGTNDGFETTSANGLLRLTFSSNSDSTTGRFRCYMFCEAKA